jgi:hypothetical protein
MDNWPFASEGPAEGYTSAATAFRRDAAGVAAGPALSQQALRFNAHPAAISIPQSIDSKTGILMKFLRPTI